jgi:hypothetical protein
MNDDNDNDKLLAKLLSGRKWPTLHDPSPVDPEEDPSPPASWPYGGSSPTLDYMRANGIPITRKNFLELNFSDGIPDPMPAGLEQEFPPEVRKMR